MTDTDTTRPAPTCAFVTLGCKVNQYDTQVIREQLLARGYREVPPGDVADVYVINSCTVTATSDSKSRKYARRAARINPSAQIVVTGCCVDSDPHLARKLSGAVRSPNLLLVGNDRKLEIGSLLAGAVDGAAERPRPCADLNTWSAGISSFAGHTRAFIKIQDGCNNFCSYCIVPHVRGSARSRPLESIIGEARRVVASGHREIVLTGIDVGQYGLDRGGADLADVVEKLRQVKGLKRLRLSSIEAMEVTDRLIELAADGALCPHFHLPLQSGSDALLARMNRRYTARQFLSVIDRIDAKLPMPSFTTDVLIGFPGETESDYQQTEDICRAAGFSRTHIFPYSDRPGTVAAVMAGRCSPRIVARRKQALAAIASQSALAYKKLFLGAKVEVLVETETDRSGRLCGYTDRYLKVLFDGPDSLKNQFVTVTLCEAEPDVMHGAIVDQQSSEGRKAILPRRPTCET